MLMSVTEYHRLLMDTPFQSEKLVLSSLSNPSEVMFLTTQEPPCNVSHISKVQELHNPVSKKTRMLYNIWIEVERDDLENIKVYLI